MRDLQENQEFLRLKNLLESTAAQYKYDFQHPVVLAISKRLDQVIVQMMHKKSS